MLDAVYAPHATYTEPGPESERMLSYPEALNEALDQEMLRDDRSSSWARMSARPAASSASPRG